MTVAREAEVERDRGEIAARLRDALERGVQAEPQQPAMDGAAGHVAEGAAELERRAAGDASEVGQGEGLVQTHERVRADALDDGGRLLCPRGGRGARRKTASLVGPSQDAREHLQHHLLDAQEVGRARPVQVMGDQALLGVGLGVRRPVPEAEGTLRPVLRRGIQAADHLRHHRGIEGIPIAAIAFRAEGAPAVRLVRVVKGDDGGVGDERPLALVLDPDAGARKDEFVAADLSRLRELRVVTPDREPPGPQRAGVHEEARGRGDGHGADDRRAGRPA